MARPIDGIEVRPDPASLRLLVVDDELEFASIIKIVAGQAGFNGTVGSSAEFEQALEDWQPAVVTLDMVMPGRDGLELLSVLSQRAFGGRIVIISGMDPTHLHMAVTIAMVKKLHLAATVAVLRPAAARRVSFPEPRPASIAAIARRRGLMICRA
jgi:CheY-like chemotaxis protein